MEKHYISVGIRKSNTYLEWNPVDIYGFRYTYSTIYLDLTPQTSFNIV